jgi:hypothetical protein
MAQTVEVEAPEFINGSQAIRILRSGYFALHTEALAGNIRTQVLAGRPVTFARKDVEAVARRRSPGKSGRTWNSEEAGA